MEYSANGLDPYGWSAFAPSYGESTDWRSVPTEKELAQLHEEFCGLLAKNHVQDRIRGYVEEYLYPNLQPPEIKIEFGMTRFQGPYTDALCDATYTPTIYISVCDNFQGLLDLKRAMVCQGIVERPDKDYNQLSDIERDWRTRKYWVESAISQIYQPLKKVTNEKGAKLRDMTCNIRFTEPSKHLYQSFTSELGMVYRVPRTG
ncbi:hypothetical protein F5B22DRAFT_656730 [Xylaria bambusicola]|uniref:uncharacterized protein n=1 Tax=Xylaria bambusicola TaxID=326684 RepID=UPI00200747EF|nr:uncharacterized protein F5B22DRAFT_656730 [Xylaria bambusicola]KAI0514492.1 hypothetical protein F5B22DRAFT_656730 [Xylaria bambusicola]